MRTLYCILFFISLKSICNNISYEYKATNLGSLTKKIAIDEFYKEKLHNLTKQKFYFEEKETIIDTTKIVRLIPILDEIPLEGADGIYVEGQTQNKFFHTNFNSSGKNFHITPMNAIEKAFLLAVNPKLTLPEATNLTEIYEKIWLNHFGTLIPCYKVRIPTVSIFDLQDVYIDAQDGEIIKIESSAQFHNAFAHVFVYSPENEPLNYKELKEVTLKNVLDIKEGDFLKSDLFQVKNCCKFYTCPNSNSCSDEEKRCALQSHTNAKQSRELLELETKTLGLDPSLNIPQKLFIDTVRCTYLSSAKATSKNNKIGFYDKPIDNNSEESERDAFSETQAYFSISTFFDRIRILLNNPRWCLREQAMSCDENGKLILDENQKPKNPYRIFVNQLMPNLESTSLNEHKSLFDQVKEGKGSKNNPIKIDRFSRLGNAAFIPALSTLKSTTPKADEILSDLLKPYDHNVFFQGNKDFAYDGDVVFHEFMHAITNTLVGKLNSLGIDHWGIHSETGALNEGWADYFAASMANSPSIGRYASSNGLFDETSLRNINNDFSCPENIIGEVHNDSQIWSAALWEIREKLHPKNDETIIKFDRAVLTALAQSVKTEDFKTQSLKLLKALDEDPNISEEIKKTAKKILDKRGITDCFRVHTLSKADKKNNVSLRNKKNLFIPSKEIIGLKNFAPAGIQLEIGLPASVKKVIISWKQYFGGSGAIINPDSEVNSKSNTKPIIAVFNVDEPIEWSFNDAYAKPLLNEEAKKLNEYGNEAQYINGRWQLTKELFFDRCDQRTLYLSLASEDLKYILENINVQFIVNEKQDTSDCLFTGSLRNKTNKKAASCSSQEAQSAFWLWLFMGILGLLRLRSKS